MNQLLYEIVGWLGFLSRPVVLLQCLTTAGFALAYALWVRPRLKARRYRVSVLGALGLWCVLRLNGLVIERLGFPGDLATYFAQVWGAWVLLAVIRLLLLTRCPAKQIQLLYSRIIQPLFVLFVAGSLVNQLASLRDVAQIPLFPLFGSPLTTSNLFLLLTIPYFLVAFSAIPLVWLGHLLQRLFHFSNGTRAAGTLVLRYLLVAVGVLWLMHRVGLNTSAIAAIAGGAFGGHRLRHQGGVLELHQRPVAVVRGVGAAGIGAVHRWRSLRGAQPGPAGGGAVAQPRQRRTGDPQPDLLHGHHHHLHRQRQPAAQRGGDRRRLPPRPGGCDRASGGGGPRHGRGAGRARSAGVSGGVRRVLDRLFPVLLD